MVQKGLSPGCAFYATLVWHGVCEFHDALRGETTAAGQHERKFAKKSSREQFHPRPESHLETWLGELLPPMV